MAKPRTDDFVFQLEGKPLCLQLFRHKICYNFIIIIYCKSITYVFNIALTLSLQVVKNYRQLWITMPLKLSCKCQPL